MIKRFKKSSVVAMMLSASLGFAADDIKIGVTGPYTGGSSSMGVSMREGVKIAIEKSTKTAAF